MKTLCLLISLTLSSVCYAQTAVEKGQPSPDDGVFLTNEEAAKIIAEKEAAQKRCDIKVETEVEKQKVNCQYEKNLLKNELDFQKKKFDEITLLIKEDFYEHSYIFSEKGDPRVVEKSSFILKLPIPAKSFEY